MRVVIQRVTQGSVSIDGEVRGEIGEGFVILLGVRDGDAIKDADYLVEKCINMRIFPDEKGRFDRSLLDIKGEALVISQFTLFADTRKGRRPGFSEAAVPEKAIPLYEYFVQKLKETGVRVATGEFGADMQVQIFNDGPVTIIVDSEDKYPKNTDS